MTSHSETDQNNNITARYAYLGGDYKPYSMTRYNELPGYSAITYYFQYNHRGDVLSMTDQWGTVVAKYTYDPWGNILSVKDGSGNDVSNNPTHRANINPIRYAGYRYDTETGLYYLLARYYDPSTYRFLTKDPDGGDKDSPLSQNPYAYADGNPVMNVDSDGEKVEFVGDKKTVKKLKKAYKKVKKTKKGGKNIKKLEKSKNVYIITAHEDVEPGFIGSKKEKKFYINVNLKPKFELETTEGWQKPSVEAQLAHEIGHAATGIGDNGKGKMNNIRANENPVRKELGQPARKSYHGRSI